MLGLPEGVTPEELAAARAALEGKIPAASTTTPAMDGTAAVGVGTTWARADHVHPSDTSKADVMDIPDALSDLPNDVPFADLNLATEIPANSNLNNYTSPGNWFVASSANAQTIANSPYTGTGYRLWVVRMTNGYYMQVALTNYVSGPRLYMRRFQPSTSTFGDWYRYALYDEKANVTNTFTVAGGLGPIGVAYFRNATNARVFIPMPNNADGLTSVTYTGTLYLSFYNGAIYHPAITGMTVVGRNPAGIHVDVSIASGSGGATYLNGILYGSSGATITATFS